MTGRLTGGVRSPRPPEDYTVCLDGSWKASQELEDPFQDLEFLGRFPLFRWCDVGIWVASLLV